MMGRKRYAAKYTNRSRYLVLLAAIAMVGSVPFHYGGVVYGIALMFVLAVVALASTLVDAVAARGR
jgi:hypothetical protein